MGGNRQSPCRITYSNEQKNRGSLKKRTEMKKPKGRIK